MRHVAYVAVLSICGLLRAQPDDSRIRPPVTQTDLEIVKRAREILDSPAKWNRADNEACDQPKSISLFCAIRMADIEVNGKFDEGGAAIGAVRTIIGERAPRRLQYATRLADYNNDPAITF